MTRAGSIALEPAYLLHARPWRETSQLCEVLSQRHGRLGLLAKGARGARSRWRGLLRPFQPLRLSWTGRGSLPVLTAAEPSAYLQLPAGEPLFAMFYLNELLMNFLSRGDPHPDLFAHYGGALASLAGGQPVEPALRSFELVLLEEAGYGLNLRHDVVSERPLEPGLSYRYLPERGPVATDRDAAGDKLVFSGAELLGIAAGDLGSGENLRAARRLLRSLLDHHLGGRPLKTRAVLSAMRGSGAA
ncbi:MAG: DNA repair protein RecO [Chromatiales bacterium]|nr:DNA repair protein RecO [Chromatiales bacterium]